MKKKSIATKAPRRLRTKASALDLRREQCEGLKQSLSELRRQCAIHFSQGPSANVIVDTQLKIREINKVFLTALGLNRDEVIGRLATKFVAPEMRAEVRKRLARGDQGRRQKHIELDLIGKSGRRTFLFFNRMIPIFQAGKIDGHLISAMDITGRKRIEETLRNREEHYREVLFSLREAAIAVFNRDGKLLYAWFSPEMSRRYGLTAEQAVGKRITEVFAGETGRLLLTRIRGVFESGQSSCQEHLFQRGGGEFWNEISLSLMKKSSGQGRSVVAFIRDITIRKGAEQARQETQEYLRLVFEHTNDGISIKEAVPPGNHWKLVMCNDRFVEMSGRSREKLMADYGRKKLLINENVPGQWATRQQKPDAGKKTCRGIDSWIRPDGRENYHEWVAAPVKMGNKVFLVSVDRDITEQILNMGAHLKLMIASEEERRRLARELHDSICQGLVGLQLTVQTAAANARTASNQSALAHAAEKCGEMIREVRSICHGLYPPALESLGLVTALNQLVDHCRHVGVVGTVECPADLTRRRFPSQVEIALYRIAQEAINNSLRHGKAKSIAVALKVENGRLHLQITDDGIGFDKDSVVSGLGLNTMRDRVDALKGMFTINSRPGKTAIKAKLPLVLPRSSH